MSEPITLINAFTVPAEESERFLELWKDNARLMAARAGFIRAHMYRSRDEGVELRFVNVAEWESRQALQEASADPRFRASAQRMNDRVHVTARPAVYEVAVDLHPGDALR